MDLKSDLTWEKLHILRHVWQAKKKEILLKYIPNFLFFFLNIFSYPKIFFEVANFFWPHILGVKKWKIQHLAKNAHFLKFWFGLKILQQLQSFWPRTYCWVFLYIFMVQKKNLKLPTSSDTKFRDVKKLKN